MAKLHRAFAPHVPGKVAFQQVDKTGTLDVKLVLTPTTLGFGNNYTTLDGSLTPSIVALGEVFPLKANLSESIAPSIESAGDVSITGKLDGYFGVALGGTGAYGQDGTLDAYVGLTSDTYGSPDNKGILSRSIGANITLIATGKIVPTRGVAAGSIAPTLNAQGATTSHRMVADLPALTVDGLMVATETNRMTMEAMTADAVMLSGGIAYGDMTMPALTAIGDSGHDVRADLPGLTVSASMAPGALYNAAPSLPVLTMSSTAAAARTITADMTIPALVSAGTMVPSGAITVDASLPALRLSSIVIAGTASNVSALLPALTSVGFLAELADIVVASSMPAFYSNAQMHNGAVAVFNPYAMNTENYMVSEYDNYAFHTVFEFEGKYYGATNGGIFELTGTDDEGTNIDASALFGSTDFRRAGLKRAPYAYLGYESDGDMTVDVSIDGDPALRQYTVGNISHESGIKRGRAKIARGLKSRYWAFGVSNVAGSDFEIDTLDLYIQQFDRKAQ